MHMKHSAEGGKPGFIERGSKLFRNLHILGAVALGGAALALPELAVPFAALAAWQVAHAGVDEGIRQVAASRRKKHG
jgi:hypothetical protein